jgi:hypothetical protein
VGEGIGLAQCQQLHISGVANLYDASFGIPRSDFNKFDKIQSNLALMELVTG